MAELEALGSKKAYDKFLSAARAVETTAVEECRANVGLAYHSVKRGLESLLSQDVPLSFLPEVNLEELRTLPLLAQGLAYAVLEWHRQLAAASFGPLFEQAQRHRRKLITAAEALAEAGLLNNADAQAVWQLGRHDVIGTCVAFSELLRKNETRVAGRSPLSSADLDEVTQVIAQLKALLAPSGSGAREELTLPSLVEAAQIRDRFWTLLKQRHDLLWRCGAWLYGRGVELRVPPLEVQYTLQPRAQPVPKALALMPLRPVVEPLREKSSPMRALQRKIRALVSVSIGRSTR